jgi:hypothetical protein
VTDAIWSGWCPTDDLEVTCRTRAEAEYALSRALEILDHLGVTLNRQKSLIVRITGGLRPLTYGNIATSVSARNPLREKGAIGHGEA